MKDWGLSHEADKSDSWVFSFNYKNITYITQKNQKYNYIKKSYLYNRVGLLYNEDMSYTIVI